MEELARTLAGERRALELLLFKLVEAQHLLADGDDRFYAWASAELDRVVELVRAAELRRALVLGGHARALADVAARAPAPYGAILDDHRASLRALLDEIERSRAASCELSRVDSDASQALTGATCGLALTSLADFLA